MHTRHPRRTLISFIGKGIRARDGEEQSHLGYRTARYGFPDPNDPENDPKYISSPTSLFGIALVKHLREDLNNPVQRWLILGSPQSNWDALIEAVPENEWGDPELDKIHSQLRTAIREEERFALPKGAGEVTQSILDKWSRILSAKLSPLSVECRLIGWCETRERQLKMWELLNEQLEPESELVLDITHGFRHQPMLLAAMVVLLSYLKQFRQVSLYYGALDMQSIPPRTEAREPQQSQVPVRVLRIDVFPELLEYIRRIGVLQIAGDYESLGKYILRNQRELKEQLEEIAFIERANLNVRSDKIDEFIDQLNQWEPEDALRGTFKPILIEELRKRVAPTPWERMALRADEADKHHDYLTAYTLLWEAIVSVSVLLVAPEKQQLVDDVDTRRECINTLTRRLSANRSRASQAQVLDAFRAARNWIVHGTPQENEWAKEAIQSKKLRSLYKEARKVFDSLLEDLQATRTHAGGSPI